MEASNRAWSAPQILWSAIIAVAVWSAIGFSWFGYGFGWRTDSTAEAMAVAAVRENLAGICVAQARDDPAALRDFAALDSWKHRSFVEEQGWAVMPGSEEAVHGVANACASRLAKA